MEATSLGDILRRSVAKFDRSIAMLVPPEKGKDAFTEISYRELGERVRHFSAALLDAGIRRGDRLAILSENGCEWAFADWASQCLGVIVVPLYPTLPTDQVMHILNDSGTKIVLVGSPELGRKVEARQDLRVWPLKGPGSITEASTTTDMSEADWNREIDATTLDDIATIIYTSGTTGVPKGAMLPHRAIAHVAWSATKNIEFRSTDRFLSFLPQSHVYERVAGQFLPIAAGASIAYAKSLASLAGDMVKTQPTVMLCVPRFLESFRDRVLDGVAKQPEKKQKLFRWALDQGVRKAQGKSAPFAWLADKLVMAKLRERTGGKIRFFVSGGAALAPNVAEFYMATGLHVLQGYGLTETAGGSCLNRPERNKYWTVGEPLDMELRIAEDGEILMRGPGLMTGYYHMPEETATAIDPEGWFHTGDIGEMEGVSLKITDRKKDLIVLGNGKNIAPQALENRLRASDYIAEAVVLGDGKDHLSALIVPRADTVLKALGLADGTVLSTSVQVKALIKKEIDDINKTVAPFEMIKKHALLDHPFTIDSGELTPTLKVKRKVIKERYADLIASMG
jgi:long-chain acyl-CoA synthetase